MMLHETPVDVYRIAEHAKRFVLAYTRSPSIENDGFRCLTLLREHAKREELLEVLLDAGQSAWTRGAHEVSVLSTLRPTCADIILPARRSFISFCEDTVVG